jgi:hypothetical protein
LVVHLADEAEPTSHLAHEHALGHGSGDGGATGRAREPDGREDSGGGARGRRRTRADPGPEVDPSARKRASSAARERTAKPEPLARDGAATRRASSALRPLSTP